MSADAQHHLEIPIIDLDDLASHDARAVARAAEGLRTAFGHFGLVYVRGHRIDPGALDAFYDGFLGFTARSEAEKAALGGPGIWYQRGWTPPNTEKAVIAGGQPDFKECYFAAPEPLDPVARQQYPQIYAENVWPGGADGFREAYLALGHQLHEIGLQLLRGSALALGLEPYRFEQLVYGGPHVTRALRYLALDETQVGTGILWGEEHTDFNLLTLLPGGRFLDPSGQRAARPDGQCGLYLRTRPTEAHPHGEMVRGAAPEGCLVAQVGQQLEILTGGTFLATPHVIKAPLAAGWTRVATAHFIHVHGHQVLYPLEPFRSPETIAAYSPPVLAGTYGTKTLVDIGLAPQAALDMLGYRHYDRLEETRA
ncbi:MAG: isopenicillin N synthase family oxygenase, partial [Myxococcales bacterium]|nr:isopenicillin N synthase family oxygenase [Myxococcales bacterium]MCB9732808.1 isopenicillin N synthase family oxygenase [Deltaproteobacteria bacterium]